jgi:hypothetical protein
MRIFSTLITRSNENKSCMRVDWISPIKLAKTLAITLKFHLVNYITFSSSIIHSRPNFNIPRPQRM